MTPHDDPGIRIVIRPTRFGYALHASIGPSQVRQPRHVFGSARRAERKARRWGESLRRQVVRARDSWEIRA
jgi:hypothetical protein